MKTTYAVKLFNNRTKELAEALGITVHAIYQWGVDVPELRAYQIREIINSKKSPSA